MEERVLDFSNTYETRQLYDWMNQWFADSPTFLWTIVGVVTAMLLGVLFFPQKWLLHIPVYGYMTFILVLVAFLDILTQKIPMITIYLIMVGYVLFRANGEDPKIVTSAFAIVFILIESFTIWHQLMILELLSHSILFLWIGWMSTQVRTFFYKVRKMKDKNRHLIGKMRNAQKQLHQFNHELQRTYYIDYLTGLYNFGGFQEQVIRSLARCGFHQSYHVICLDLTGFKQINMSKGMDVGDQILKEIASQLMRRLPPSAHVARYDGDQFAVGVMGDQAVFRRCLETMEKVMLELQADRRVLHHCIGTASYPREATSGAELVRLAEQRLATEQRRLRHKEEERRRHLEKLSVVGQLAAGLAHEIRNPLTSIRGFVQISAMESEAVKKWESIILPEIDRINDLLKQFLNLSESRPTRYTRFELDQLMNDVIRLLQPKAFLMGHDLIAQAPLKPIEMEADAEQVKQVLINLIQNGLEALEDKGKIEVRWKEMKGRVSIRIHDTGSGIHPNHFAKIFDPFFTTKGEGTGMGLSICHRIITDHQGQIQVASQPNQGTTFLLHLPLKRNNEESHQAKRKDPHFYHTEPPSPFLHQERSVR
ncbi:ATP-binding protein [Hazenella coriacea]|uniref:ATP-binding protein n=1 Tax=Hazenella coriacea TaxID=1179467 RepID=UPI001046DC69|nr:ATP-binding protein [Hazenella coriacea]